MLNRVFLFLILFVSISVAQLMLVSKQDSASQALTKTELDLLKNTVFPVFLTDSPELLEREVIGLIQNTKIYQVQVFSMDNHLLLNATQALDNETANVEQYQQSPIYFQGAQAGYMQAATLPKKEENAWFYTATLWLISLLVATTATALSFVNRLIVSDKSKGNSGHSISPLAITNVNQEPLCYLFIYPELTLLHSLSEQTKLQVLQSFMHMLEKQLAIYEGSIVSFCEDYVLCRLPCEDILQSTLFTWGVSQLQLVTIKEKQIRLPVRSLLDVLPVGESKTEQLALFSLLQGDFSHNLKQLPIAGFLTKRAQALLTSQDIMIQREDVKGVHQIMGVKPSMERLWLTQIKLNSNS